LADIFSKEKRSQIMSAVKNKNTKPEILVRKHLFRAGFRYSIHKRELPGSPDILLPKYKSVIFVHGCFWHGHSNCKKAINANSNKNFWNQKILENRNRDQRVKRKLNSAGWRVITLWECDLRNQKSITRTINKLITRLKKSID
jgi:DNA mismatch endonuclease (patch repair protein)